MSSSSIPIAQSSLVPPPPLADFVSSLPPPHRSGQAWFCASGLPSDLTVEVDDMIFHLHQYPLISRSGKFAMLVAEALQEEEQQKQGNDTGEPCLCHIQLKGMPGGSDIFELVAEFCYGVKVELTSSNVAALRCAAEFLHMSEEYGEQNLIRYTEVFINRVAVKSWEDCVRTLKTCESLLPQAEELSIVDRCVEYIAIQASTDSVTSRRRLSSRNSDGGRKTGSNRRRSTSTVECWWYEDVSILSLPLFKCVIKSMEEKGLSAESVAGAVVHYAKKLIPGLHRRKDRGNSSSRFPRKRAALTNSDTQQLYFIETIEKLLPSHVQTLPTSFLCSLLKIALILHSSPLCRSNLEKRVAAQLHLATLDDLLIPNYSQSMDTLYDVDCVLRIVKRFLAGSKKLAHFMGDASSPTEEEGSYENQIAASNSSSSASAARSTRKVASLMDAYMAEVASDSNLTSDRFQSLVEALPPDARSSHDGLYKAIDIFLKTHGWMREAEKEKLCEAIDCQRLSLDACAHVAQNERLPMRMVLQVLFVEQTQLRGAIMGCLERGGVATMQAANGAQTSIPLPSSSQRSSNDLVTDMLSLRLRISELERESTRLRRRLSLKTSSSSHWASKLTCKSLVSDVSDSSASARFSQSPSHPAAFPKTVSASNSPAAAAAAAAGIHKGRRSVTYLDTIASPATHAALHRPRRRSTSVRPPFLSLSPM